jgi:hypothetical protein
MHEKTKLLHKNNAKNFVQLKIGGRKPARMNNLIFCFHFIKKTGENEGMSKKDILE